MSEAGGRKEELGRAARGRRRFLACNGLALLGALALRLPGRRLLPDEKSPHRGREARWYRRVR